MTKHTPGPWSFDRDWSRLPTIFAADGKTKIAVVEKTSRNEHTSEQAANARLIEAAPDLLAELKEIVEWDRVEAVRLRDIEINHIKAVIAKAEGAVTQDKRGTP